MIIYLYDGSFEGLLTAVFDAYEKTEIPDEIVYDKKFNTPLFFTPHEVLTDPEKASRVAVKIAEKMGHYSLQTIIYCYLSEMSKTENAIFHYIKHGLNLGESVNSYLTDSNVATVLNLSKKVLSEAHRLKGLVRFTQIEDILYAPVSPDFNVTSLLAEHFIKRLSGEKWILHDTRRKSAVYYDSTELYQLDIKDELKQILKKYGTTIKTDEDIYSALWKTYFKAISIESKQNLKLQRQHMPKKYWQYLTEKIISQKKEETP